MVIHVPCNIHLADLILKHVLDFDLFGIVSKSISDLVNLVNSPVGRGILGGKCPKLVKTRWIHLFNALHFILSRLGALHTVLQISEQPLISEEYMIVHRILTPLPLFSRAIE
jgi:hypothetical protein